jgi:hypothetical protein
MDFASPKKEGQEPWTAFRISAYGQSLLEDEVPDIPQLISEAVHIRSKGWIRIPPTVPRKVRYQIARFCEWLPMKRESYMYSLSPDSLMKAKEQELQAEHLLALLGKHAELVPPNLIKALQRWDQHGIQAAMEKETVLRVRSPAMLEAIRESRAKRYLRETLGPTAVVIQEGSESKIAEVVMEMGFLVDYIEGPQKEERSGQEGEEDS